MNCPACGHELPPAATFCPACRDRGQASLPPPAPVVTPIAPAPQRDDPRERFFLIVAVLLSAGALAIPRVRRTKAFGPRGKAILITVAVLQTGVVIGVIACLPWAMKKWIRYVESQTYAHRRF